MYFICPQGKREKINLKSKMSERKFEARIKALYVDDCTWNESRLSVERGKILFSYHRRGSTVHRVTDTGADCT